MKSILTIILTYFFIFTTGLTAKPISETLFLRGSFNNWGTNHSFKFQPKTGTYQTSLKLDQGKFEFKISDTRWSGKRTYSGAQKASTILKLNKETQLVAEAVGFGNNTRVTIAKPGTYRFLLRFDTEGKGFLKVLPIAAH